MQLSDDMDKILIDKIAGFPLFKGIQQNGIAELIDSLKVRLIEYGAGEVIVLQGEENSSIGVIIQGLAKGGAVSEDGSEYEISYFREADIFGEILSGSGVQSPVTVSAVEKTTVLLIPFNALVGWAGDIAVKSQFITNLFSEIAQKYFTQKKRLSILCVRPLQKRILRYLESLRRDDGYCRLELNREQLAEYLCCDRAALCRELSALKRLKYIDYDRNYFRILQ